MASLQLKELLELQKFQSKILTKWKNWPDSIDWFVCRIFGRVEGKGGFARVDLDMTLQKNIQTKFHFSFKLVTNLSNLSSMIISRKIILNTNVAATFFFIN